MQKSQRVEVSVVGGVLFVTVPLEQLGDSNTGNSAMAVRTRGADAPTFEFEGRTYKLNMFGFSRHDAQVEEPRDMDELMDEEPRDMDELMDEEDIRNEAPGVYEAEGFVETPDTSPAGEPS